MSLGRMGARTALVGTGVLASVAMMAAPSWAAKGNSANAALCEPGGYPGVLFNQLGEAFKNEGACTKYAAKGGQIAGVNVVEGPAEVVGTFTATCSGFGLKPASSFTCEAMYGKITRVSIVSVAADGTASGSLEAPCSILGANVHALIVDATTAEGTVFERTFPPPSGPPSGC